EIGIENKALRIEALQQNEPRRGRAVVGDGGEGRRLGELFARCRLGKPAAEGSERLRLGNIVQVGCSSGATGKARLRPRPRPTARGGGAAPARSHRRSVLRS